MVPQEYLFLCGREVGVGGAEEAGEGVRSECGIVEGGSPEGCFGRGCGWRETRKA